MIGIRQKILGTISFVLITFGLYAPTSIGALESSQLTYVNFSVLGLSLLMFIILRKKLNVQMAISFILINLILWISTLFSRFYEMSWGAGAIYFLLSLVFCLKIRDFVMPKVALKAFKFLNILNLIIGYAVVIGQEWASSFLIKYYSAYYPELLPNMMNQHKPVLTFATHSIAGFFLFIFFYMNIKTYKVTEKRRHLVLALLYLGLCYFLNSTTGYMFLFIGFALLIYFIGKIGLRKNIILIFLFILLSLFNTSTILDTLQNTWLAFESKLSSTNNGFASRFSENGNLQNNLKYIADHPFSPVGITYSSNFMYADSGMIEMTLRGSVFFAVLIYSTFFIFLRKNLLSKGTAYFLFAMFMLFEIGFSNLTYHRTIFLLPVIIMYLNYLETMQVKEEMKSEEVYREELLRRSVIN